MRMEAAQAGTHGEAENSGNGLANPLIELQAAQPGIAEPYSRPRFDYHTDPMAAYSADKRRSNHSPEVSQPQSTPPSVSNCYVFKSRLQEYAQKVGLPTPVYETLKEGPSHEPTFRSTVIVNNIRYDSLPGFFNRKAAEQSAAEVALLELSQSGDRKECISQPVHDTGLCKNLLQEYAQKMNYAIPLYECRKEQVIGKTAFYSCTVEIGGVKYIGGVAKTKKEAELKAARTALLAIESDPSKSHNNPTDYSLYTVVPLKKKVADLGISHHESAAALKPKKGQLGRLKRKPRKKRKRLPKIVPELGTNDATALQVTNYGLSHEYPQREEVAASVMDASQGLRTPMDA